MMLMSCATYKYIDGQIIDSRFAIAVEEPCLAVLPTLVAEHNGAESILSLVQSDSESASGSSEELPDDTVA